MNKKAFFGKSLGKKAALDTLKQLIIYVALLIVLIGLAYYFREKILEQIQNLFKFR